MRKILLIGVLMLVMAAPAGATVYVTNGSNPQDITVTLVIDCYTNIYWNNTDDQNIVFNDDVQDGSNSGDWWSSVLIGAYGTATKSSQDPWAEGYYESYDTALFWLDTNCDATMTLTCSGNLDNGAGAELPTWFTTALTNNTDCTCNVDCGFINGGVRQSKGQIPMDCEGYYADDTNSDNVMEHMGTHYPNQYAFPMEVAGTPQVYTMPFTAHAQGTILFHARVLRSGMADNAGTYTATINVGF